MCTYLHLYIYIIRNSQPERNENIKNPDKVLFLKLYNCICRSQTYRPNGINVVYYYYYDYYSDDDGDIWLIRVYVIIELAIIGA